MIPRHASPGVGKASRLAAAAALPAAPIFPEGIGAPLGGQADDAVGASFGRQFFFDHTRQQLLLEVGGRYRYSDLEGLADDAILLNQTAAGGALRYQAAMGRRFVFVLDGIGRYDMETEDNSVFGRLELVLKP